MILSIPRTTSRKVSVNNETQAAESEKTEKSIKKMLAVKVVKGRY
jgi:hypothetical protein